MIIIATLKRRKTVIVLNNKVIEKNQKNLARLILSTVFMSFGYIYQGFSVMRRETLHVETQVILQDVTAALVIFSLVLLYEAVRLFVVTILECRKVGKTGKGNYIHDVFEDPEDYYIAVKSGDGRVSATVLFNAYCVGVETLNDFNVLGKYAECLWFMQGLVIMTATRNFMYLVFPIIVLAIWNHMQREEHVSFQNAVMSFPAKVMHESEK